MRIVLLGLSLILAVALMGFGPNPQTIEELLGQAPPGRAAGRAAIGFVADPSTGEGDSAVMGAVMNGAIGRVITVLTENGAVSFTVDENTRITSPSGSARVLERIAEGLPVRIALVADRLLVDGDGTPIAEPAVARQLMIIPVKATREHRRVIIAEKGTAAKAIALDEDGDSIDLAVDGAEDGGGISLSVDDIPEQGESAVLLVRRNENQGGQAQIRAVVKMRKVIDRLSDLAGNSKLQDDDPFKSAQLEEVLERHQNAVKKLLERVRDRTEDRFKEVVNRAVDQAKTKAEQRKKVRGVVSGLSEESAECANRILGRVPVTKKEIPPGQLRRVEVQCFGQGQEGPDLKIISPGPRTQVNEGDTLFIEIETEEEDGGVTLELRINGELVTPDTVTRTSISLEYTVLAGTSLVTILAKATDQNGNIETDDRVVHVRPDPPPRVEIRSPEENERLVAGSSYRFTTYSEDNGEVVSVEIYLNDVRYLAEKFEVRGPTRDENGVLIPIPSGVASVTVRVVATDNVGNIGTTTRLFRVGSDAAPTVSITSPKEGTELRAGESITVEVLADDNGEVSSVAGSVTQSGVRTPLVFKEFPQMDWRSTSYVVRGGATSFGAPDTSVLPHIFTGTVTLDGVTAPDNTKVAATLERARDSVVSIEVTATDDNGNTASATREFKLRSTGVEIISGVVSGGTFILLLEQPLGESFGGEEIKFTVGGREAQSATWERGGATELNLSAGVGR